MKTRSGHLYQKTNGGTWYVRTQVDGKVIVRSTKTKNRREAEKRRTEIMEPYALGDRAKVFKEVVNKLHETESKLAALNEPPPLAIETAWIKYNNSGDRPDSGDSTLDRYHSIWKRFENWIADNHADIETLDQVTEQLTAAYVESLKAAKFTASTFNQHKNFLKLLWTTLTPHRPNPWQRIKSHKLDKLRTRKRALTSSQFEDILAAAENEPELYDLLVVLAWTGLRLVDAALMQWSAIDFMKNVLTAAPVKTARRQAKVLYIPIFPAALEVFNRRQSGKVLDPTAFVFPELAAIYMRDKSVLAKKIGMTFTQAGIKTRVDQVNRKLALVVYGAHSLRHFFVTVATEAGMPDAMIKSITGHSTDSMLEHYQQIGENLAAELSLRIGGAKVPVLLDAPKQAGMGSEATQAIKTGLMDALAALDNGDADRARELITGILEKL